MTYHDPDTATPPLFVVAWWPIASVRAYEHNPRRIQPSAIAKVAASLRAFGWRQPLVVDGDGVLIAGHVRLAAARDLGLSDVPVHVASTLSDEQVCAYRLADNRTHEEATWDEDLLIAELARFTDTDLAVLTGFDAAELDRYLGGLVADAPAANEQPGGDVGATENGFEYQERYGVIVECADQDHQRRVFAELSAAGHTCRVVAV